MDITFCTILCKLTAEEVRFKFLLECLSETLNNIKMDEVQT